MVLKSTRPAQASEHYVIIDFDLQVKNVRSGRCGPHRGMFPAMRRWVVELRSKSFHGRILMNRPIEFKLFFIFFGPPNAGP